MEFTEYSILNDPSVRHRALLASKWAIDIKYKCPECCKDRVFTWLFPNVDMLVYTDMCHNKEVRFKGYEYEEE